METTDLVLRKTISVAQPPEVAFRVFTEEVGTWWPAAGVGARSGT